MFRTEFNPADMPNKYGGYSPDIVRLVPNEARVLDVGCSTGVLARELRLRGCRVTGLDIDEASLALAAQYCETAMRCNLDHIAEIDALPFGSEFDVITMGDVVEHLKYPGATLKRMRHFLKPGGVLIASIPNAAFIQQRMRFMLGDFAYTIQGGLMDEDHLHLFSFQTVRAFLQDAGYVVEKIYGASVVRKRYFFSAMAGAIISDIVCPAHYCAGAKKQRVGSVAKSNV